MELDFKTVKALSSPTRIRILNRLLESEETPTSLSRVLDKSKSTISSHLSILVRSGLVEKDEKEGRRRVTYRPTRKASTIVKGRERKMKFSITSAALSGIAGLWLFFDEMPGASYLGKTRSEQLDSGAGDMGTLSMETASKAPPQPDGLLFGLQPLELAGAGLVVLAVLLVLYGIFYYRLGR